MTDALALEVRRLAAVVEDMRESHDHLVRRLLDRDDRRTGSALVPLLAEVFPSQSFTVADLAARVLNDRTPIGQAVRELAHEYVTDEGGLKGLGRLFARLEGMRFSGCRLQLDGRPGGIARWRVGFSLSETNIG